MSESNEGGVFSGLVAVCWGALVAIVLGYAICYVLVGFGFGVVGAAERPVGKTVFSQAALNLCAMQHVTLAGKGTAPTGEGGASEVTGAISVPISLWAAVPAAALFIGGFAAARASRRGSRSGKIACAVLSGMAYGLTMAAGSRIVSARIDSFLMPEFAGVGSNPPEFPFRPSTRSALLYAGIFGVIWSYFGAAVAARKQAAGESPSKWWPCVKATIVIALAIQLPMAGYLVFAEPNGNGEQEAEPTVTTGVIELIPTAAGLGYAMIHGADVTAGAVSHFKPTERTRRLFHAAVNLYSGVIRDDDSEKSRRGVPLWGVVVAVFVGVAGAFAMGRLAVRWGSRDGSLPTALRIALAHTTYLALLVAYCACSLVTTDALSFSALSVAPNYGIWLLYSFLAVSLVSLLGASSVGARSFRLSEV